MHITMVKKRLADGEPCEKCAQTEEMLKRKGLWHRIDEVLWAIAGEDDSPGAQVAARHGVKLAPFFVVRDDDGVETVMTSALRMVRQVLESAPTEEPREAPPPDLAVANRELANADPFEILRFGLERYGQRCAIAFSGAEDVVLIDMATSLGLPFSVFTLDTGRLHNETYQFIDDVRRRYGFELQTVLPDASEVTDLMNTKGPNSFFQDGHWECCGIRKFRPLGRALARFDAWATGRCLDGRAADPLPVVQTDPSFQGTNGSLLRLNPLARWTREDVFEYIRLHEVPTNPLHDRGFASIGCAPCTRTRAESLGGSDRWWWEEPVERKPTPDPGSGI